MVCTRLVQQCAGNQARIIRLNFFVVLGVPLLWYGKGLVTSRQLQRSQLVCQSAKDSDWSPDYIYGSCVVRGQKIYLWFGGIGASNCLLLPYLALACSSLTGTIMWCLTLILGNLCIEDNLPNQDQGSVLYIPGP